VDVVTLLAIALALAVGYIAGRFHQHHRASLLAENIHWVGEYNEAIKGADLDADVAAHRRERLSGEQPAVSNEPAQPRPTPIPLGERECNNCHKPAVFAWKTDGFPFAACNLCVSLWFEDGLPDHVMRLDAGRLEGVAALAEVLIPGAVVEVEQPSVMWCAKSVEGWCAVVPNEEPEEGAFSVETVCGYGITLPGGYDQREPTCPDCRGTLAAYPVRAWSAAVHDPWVHASCGTELTRDDDGTEWCSTCGTTVTAIHADDDTSSTGPRSVPGPRGRVSD
jgi:hypothetical protein